MGVATSRGMVVARRRGMVVVVVVVLLLLAVFVRDEGDISRRDVVITRISLVERGIGIVVLLSNPSILG